MAYRRVARRKARKYGLDPGVFEAQIQQESGFNPSARSPAGASGIAQIMPATARGWGVDPSNPRAALDAAAKNMASYVRKYGGIENALRAYNAGPAAIEKSKGYAETNNYVRTILAGKDPDDDLDPAPARGPGGRTRTRTTTTRTPGISNAAARGQLIANFLEDKDSDPLDLALGIRGLADVPGSETTKRVRVRGQRQRVRGRPRARGAGAGAGEIHELFWNGPGAQNIDEGKAVGKGFVSGHTDHVHLAADQATMQRAEAEAKRLGLNVGEYGRGITSGHAPGSFHYQPKGAMDVSGDPAKMALFAKRVARGRI